MFATLKTTCFNVMLFPLKITGRLLQLAIFAGLAAMCTGTQAQIPGTPASQLRQDIQYLSADSLEGRLTGSSGEQKAARYISRQFNAIGLQPRGSNNSYLQPFTFTAERQYTGNNRLRIGKIVLVPEKDYYALPEAANGKVKGTLAAAGYGIEGANLTYTDYHFPGPLNGKVLLINIAAPEGLKLPDEYRGQAGINKKIATAVQKGAAAIIFYNTDTTLADPDVKMGPRVVSAGIPVLFLKAHAYKKLQNAGNNPKVTLQLETRKIEKTGHNVAGYLDNKAPHTVVIGAHYDHLGYGESGNSLHTGTPAIHNGADDNASGVAAMLEIARQLKNNPQAPRSNNYLFVAFSGEELGLFGSNYFVQHATVPMETVNYMLNYDMVGRLDSINKTLTINGAGTSPGWQSLNRITTGNLNIKTTESGVGPSDHTSFYWQKIPAIHFFTGIHTDYHKPADDWEKINYRGIEEVVQYSLELINTLNEDGKLTFTPTKTEESQKAPKYKVTLGIMPDYAFEGTGVRITGVVDGRPAQTAGLQSGDIITQIDDTPVKDMYSYMNALGKLSTGKKSVVIILREGKEEKINVQF